MARIQQWIIFLLVCVHLSYQSTPNSPYYMAAVVEYPPRHFKDANKTLEANSNEYVKHIETASLTGVDIIVFPEYGLTSTYVPSRAELQDWTTVIPDVASNYTPCSDDTIRVSEALKKISCAAKDYKIYVLINIAEKLPCIEDECPRDKVFYYNSNVAFDRTGKIIARYRKTNLFFEPQFNVTKVPELVTFDTDFGVKFGTFICFDILFQEPALVLTRVHNITDIIYPTEWFSELPFLSAVQTQAAWSFSENVNLLASNYDRPEFGNTGSGIYLGRKGVGTAIFPTVMHEELLIFRVPKIKERTVSQHHGQSTDHDQKVESVQEGLNDENNVIADIDKVLFKYENFENYETSLLEGNITKIICQNNFCCDFKVEVTVLDPNVKYHLAVFNGVRQFERKYEANILACGVIQCSNGSVSSCGSLKKSETEFSNIEIATTYHDYKNILIMPSTLGLNMLPLNGWKYDDHAHDDHMHINMYLNIKTKNITTFGLYARHFEKNNANRVSFVALDYLITLSLTLLLSRFF